MGKLRFGEQIRGLESQSCRDGVREASRVKGWNKEKRETVRPQVRGPCSSQGGSQRSREGPS